MMAQLSPELVSKILGHLGMTAVPTPSLTFLDQLMAAYCRTVPWESAFRIVRRAMVADTADCPRWPAQFWQEHLTMGAGGTCFESNYAYLCLLQALGFQGYLTINNMGDSIGCHSAIVVLLDGQKWLVDAGLPIFASLPLSPQGVMHRTSQFMHYRVRPDGQNRYQVERWPHPRYNAFTLIDAPIAEAAYRARTTADYSESGLFLDAVIINKVINGFAWNFNMRERPWQLYQFDWGVRREFQPEGEVATAVAHHFGLDEATVQQAFGIVNE
jgi:hypothetical protein